MSTALGARATSFAAASVLLGLLGAAALSMSIALRDAPDWGPTPPPLVIERPPPAPPTSAPRVVSRPPPPDAPPIETADPMPPPPPIDHDALPYVGPLGPVAIVNPAWLRRPSNLDRYYPARALERGIEGDVVLDCLVSTQGALDCSVVAEAPRGWGFAEAALRIARDHLMAPARRDGMAVEGRYRMRTPFRVH